MNRFMLPLPALDAPSPAVVPVCEQYEDAPVPEE
jgi:hypothetical protein